MYRLCEGLAPVQDGGGGGVPGLAPPLYSGLPNEVRPWKAFHGIQGAVVVLGFETVSDAVDPHG